MLMPLIWKHPHNYMPLLLENCVPEETVNADTSVPEEMFIEGGANVYVLDTEDTFNGEEISIQYPDSDSISNCESYLYI